MDDRDETTGHVEAAIVSGISQNRAIMDLYGSVGDCGIGKTEFFAALLRLMEQKRIPNVLMCRCGHDCSRCVTFRATLFDDNALRKAAVRYYQSIGIRLTMEDIHCLGGCSDEQLALCRECPWTACCTGKGIKRCSDCPDYPCPPLDRYRERYVNKANIL